ncbi:glycosyl hydrolase [Opitutus sp. ER46]|uniref:glycosyl hydrolase n=1 Tax=Opitutus sp. ER46 TaxID=2161864 RepID=UPI0011B25615|nr:glycosyl hydrolase [Opitutus sp. ER46]
MSDFAFRLGRGLRLTWLATLATVVTVATGTPPGADPLASGFRQPEAAARPLTLWFWMNGNVSRDGITRDLEAMKRVGIGGAIVFDGGTYQPAGAVDYLSRSWREAILHAAKEAERLGLTLGMHNSPGWSSSGGPWITPELSMKQLVWTETTVVGPQKLDANLRAPRTQLGFYRDAFVVAFPAPAAEAEAEPEMRASLRSGLRVESAVLTDDDVQTAVKWEAADALELTFARPITVMALTAEARTGSPAVPLRIEVAEDGRSFRELADVTLAAPAGIRPPAVASFPAVTARHFRIRSTSAVELGEFRLHRTARLPGWTYQANQAYRFGTPGRSPMSDTAVAASQITPDAVLNLTSQLDANGRLKWEVPPGAWIVMRFGYTSTGMRNTSASASGTGLECDKLGREGVEAHFEAVQARLRQELGPALSRVVSTVTIDSYEAGMQNWTASFPGEFRRRMGYDLVRYLPAMTGRIVGDAAVTEQFLFDVRTVQAAMVAENYYGRMAELCRERGLTLFVEGYGSGMFDELEVSGVADVPMGEFWTRTPWSPNRNMKMVASAAHLHDRRIVAAEAFTGEQDTSRWLDYPYALKVVGDDMFALGVNQLVFHRFVHQPHPDALPGMAMGPWGFHFDRTNTWFDQSAAWVNYLARCQHLLRQGRAVADVLYFVGERPPNPAQMVIPALPRGYTFDHIDAATLIARARVRDGAIEVAEGTRYRVLVLPPDLEAMTPETLRKLAALVRDGAVVAGPAPRYSPSLRGYPASDDEMRRLADELWAKGQTGAGRVIADRPLAAVLTELGVEPDLKWTGRQSDAALSWHHRTLADGDLYFISNRQRRVEEVLVSFRVTGRQPEIWNAEDGTQGDATVFAQENGRTQLPLRLEPAQSVFVLFRRRTEGAAPARLRRGETVLVDTRTPTPGEATDATGDFTMAVWAKPDTDLRLMPEESTSGRVDETGKFYVIGADERDVRFGAGHATAGVAVGRNGVFVIERASDQAPAVLVATLPISGWAHVAVTYQGGVPSLYVNGRLVRRGLRSGRVVHPGIGAPLPAPDSVLHFAGLDQVMGAAGLASPPAQGRAFHFEGNATAPELLAPALTADAIAERYERGLPAPGAPPLIELKATEGGGVRGLAWESGRYELDGVGVAVADVAPALTLGGPWKVRFPAGRGAPAAIELPALQPLERHEQAGVRFFSGTMTYARRIRVAEEWLGRGRRVVLDLGRVEVLAEVRVNGRDLGVLWKEPYRVDITAAVQPGQNALEVRVTNLLANRMIGDEQLPPENEYGAGAERGIRRFPDWYARGQPKPRGGRVTFTTWKFFERDDPLPASGLLGPVRLLNPVEVEFRAEAGAQAHQPQ